MDWVEFVEAYDPAHNERFPRQLDTVHCSDEICDGWKCIIDKDEEKAAATDR